MATHALSYPPWTIERCGLRSNQSLHVAVTCGILDIFLLIIFQIQLPAKRVKMMRSQLGIMAKRSRRGSRRPEKEVVSTPIEGIKKGLRYLEKTRTPDIRIHQ